MGYRIGILGATGAVGREMIKCIEEYALPVDELRPFASSRSVGKKLPFNGGEVTVTEAGEGSFDGLDFVLGAVGGGMAKEYAPKIVAAGAVFIDNSSSFRMDPDVPLVVPEINGNDALQNKGIISNPNCSTIITMMAIAGIAKLSPIRTIVACTYQAASGAGQKGIDDLLQQEQALMAGQPVVPTKFPTQLVRNVIPFIGAYKENGYTDEEMKMQNEGRKILHMPDMKVTCTCVRVPVMRSHAISATLVTEKRLELSEIADAIRAFPGVKLVEAGTEPRDYPTPVETSNQDDVYVGRIRRDLTNENGVTLWCCGDQIRKGAAANAVQIMRLLMK